MSAFAPKTIVVPVDFSEASLAAIDTALEIGGSGATVYVVHILPELNIGEPGVVWQTIDNASRTENVTRELRNRLSDDRYADLKFHVRFGDPGYRVAELVEELGTDLIVASSHGRTGIKRWLVGSVAERIVRLAHCPVLLLR